MADSLTISDFFADSVARRRDDRALGYIRAGELHWLTWQQVADQASQLAAALRAVGIAPGDRVAQVSENRHEWIITDLAVHLAGAVHVPIHITLSGEQIAEQIADSGARLVFVSSQAMLARFVDLAPKAITYVIHDEQTGSHWTPVGVEATSCRQPPALPGVDPTENSTHSKPPAEPGAASRVAAHNPAPSPQPPASTSLATILYTSGTTGRSRGVMLSHANLASNAAATADAFGDDHPELRLCVLPLSHIYARTCDLYTWIYRGSQLVLCENRETLARDLQIVRPSALNAVPYIYQKIADRIRSGPGDHAQQLRDFFGGRIEQLNCGGAPLAPETEAWYADHGLPVLLGYGLTETSPVIAASTPAVYRPGAVGRPLRDIEVRIADDGEILTRGPHVMLGYWQDDAATADSIRNGWFHTGDLGKLDADGFLSINGRKKELIVLSTGKKVAPSRVELLLTASPMIEQACVFGDNRCGLIALIVPAACGLAPSPDADDLRTRYAAEITRCLASAAQEEQVHHFALLDRPFSLDHGEMTGKLSLCRAVIARNFAAQIAAMQQPQSHESAPLRNHLTHPP